MTSCKKFLSLPKKFVGEPFSASIISSVEKCFCLRMLGHDFPSKLICLRTPNLFLGKKVCNVAQGNRRLEKD